MSCVFPASFGTRRRHASTDARNAAWFTVNDLPELAFDHEMILSTAHERLKGKVRYQPIGFELLPEKFTLRQMQHLYEVILDRELDKRNFRKKVLGMEKPTEADLERVRERLREPEFQVILANLNRGGAQLPKHVCGAQGFGHPGDRCVACESE